MKVVVKGKEEVVVVLGVDFGQYDVVVYINVVLDECFVFVLVDVCGGFVFVWIYCKLLCGIVGQCFQMWLDLLVEGNFLGCGDMGCWYYLVVDFVIEN